VTGRVEGAALLEVRGLTKSFGAITAVRDVDLVVGPGERVGLVGPNGAGKTTLFNCICGQTQADAGTVVFRGIDLGSKPTFERARLGIGRTFQRV
jgi:branched-chain amino acid transport system ATP-binding protein